MIRNGTLTLLGAGASANVGYPTANGLLNLFEAAVNEASKHERQEFQQYLLKRAELEREATNLPPGQIVWQPEISQPPTDYEWFKSMWDEFLVITRKLKPLAIPKLGSDGRIHWPSPPVYGFIYPPYTAPLEGKPQSSEYTPYLETFFAFYDDYMRPIIAAVEGDTGKLWTTQYHFRRLRKIAFETAFHAFSAYNRPPATYLSSLFKLQGPGKHGCTIATLNFDVTIEQIACAFGIALCDGFAQEQNATITPPHEWDEPGFENLKALWTAITENGWYEFIGTRYAPEDSNLLLKLHGSLCWYTLEEGSGDIGTRDELRHNTAYRHFRVPYEFLWRPDMKGLVDQLASGGPNDPVTRTKSDSLSRKAGAVWVQPYLVFARALKTHPDRLSLDLMTTFTHLLDRAATVLVIGYSWGDTHINDLIFDAVARGASLINVSKSVTPENVLALWRQRFPTTYHVLRRRLFMFGGGAKRVLEEHSVTLPSGESLDLDLVESVAQGLPVQLSLEQTLDW